MDFTFSEEQTAIRELAREILEREATTERVKAAEADGDWFDRALWKTLAEANLLGVATGEAHGGMGFGFLELCVVLEEIGRRVPPVPALETLVLGALPLAAFGSDAQRARWLPAVAAGEAVLTGAPVDAEPCRARPDGDGWRLDGAKRFVGFAGQADAILVPALAPDGAAAFLVETGATDGIQLRPGTISTGQPLWDVTLSGVRVSDDARLPGGAEGAGARGRLGPWLEQRALVAVAALQTGVSSRALEITADYAREREQFGVPIGSFQAVQHRAADAFIDLEALRWTTWRAAWRLAAGLPAEREARVAKFWAAEAGARIAASCLHLHGGIGSDVDYPIHRYFLWSRALELCLGGASPQLARLGRDMASTGPAGPQALESA